MAAFNFADVTEVVTVDGTVNAVDSGTFHRVALPGVVSHSRTDIYAYSWQETGVNYTVPVAAVVHVKH
jgi:hypothetical protein